MRFGLYLSSFLLGLAAVADSFVAAAPVCTSPNTRVKYGNQPLTANELVVYKAVSGIFVDKNLNVANTLIAENLIEHAPTSKNGREAYKAEAAALFSQTGYSYQIGFIASDGNIVSVHSVLRNSTAGTIIVDIFRVENGIIREHWDVTQAEVTPTASGLPMHAGTSEADTILASDCTPQKQAANKALVVTGINELFNNGNVSIVDVLWSTEYFQHNPKYVNGTAPIKAAFTPYVTNPDFLYDIGFVTVKCDIVMVHGWYHFTTSADNGLVAVDIFRVKDNLIYEHWDAIRFHIPANLTATGTPAYGVNETSLVHC